MSRHIEQIKVDIRDTIETIVKELQESEFKTMHIIFYRTLTPQKHAHYLLINPLETASFEETFQVFDKYHTDTCAIINLAYGLLHNHYLPQLRDKVKTILIRNFLKSIQADFPDYVLLADSYKEAIRWFGDGNADIEWCDICENPFDADNFEDERYPSAFLRDHYDSCCESCASENADEDAFQCGECDEYQMVEDAHDERDPPELCDACLDNLTRGCTICDERFFESDQSEENIEYNQDVCPRCFEEYIRRCKKCNDFFDSEYSNSDVVCDSCFEDVVNELRTTMDKYDVGAGDLY